MNTDKRRLESYAQPSIVSLGPVQELTRQNVMGDTCDGTPCTGNYYYWKGKAGDEPPHDHDPKKPLRNPRPSTDKSGK